MSKGSALIEVMVLGMITMLVVIQVAVSANRIQSAAEQATTAATVAAQWAARHSDVRGAEQVARSFARGAESVTATRAGTAIEVVVVFRVALVGEGLIMRTVTGRAQTEISPYRSNRG